MREKRQCSVRSVAFYERRRIFVTINVTNGKLVPFSTSGIKFRAFYRGEFFEIALRGRARTLLRNSTQANNTQPHSCRPVSLGLGMHDERSIPLMVSAFFFTKGLAKVFAFLAYWEVDYENQGSRVPGLVKGAHN